MKKGGDGSYLSPGKLASLWGVDEAVFEAGVMRRTVKAGGTDASVALNAAQASLHLHLPTCFRSFVRLFLCLFFVLCYVMLCYVVLFRFVSSFFSSWYFLSFPPPPPAYFTSFCS